MKHGFLPFNYFGIPLFKGKPKVSYLKPIVDKILAHFDAWQGEVISYAGCVHLKNLVITSSFVHMVIIYAWLAELLNYMEKAICNFLRVNQ